MGIIISKEEYKRRDRVYQQKKYDSKKAKKNYQEKLKAQGKLTKKEKMDIQRQKIKSLMEQGFSQKEISKKLNIPSRTVERRVQELKALQNLV